MTRDIRPAGPADRDAMAGILNRIIRAGGLTARTRPVSAEEIGDWMRTAGDRSAWHVVARADGAIRGVQWIAPHPELPPEACDIATFVSLAERGRGLGTALLQVTLEAARERDYGWINACVRRDNAGARAFYGSRGFVHWRDWPDAPVAPRILMRRDL
ncbi:N-acetyltransferase family protein [Rhodovulum sp. YNF3179]|uniref:GNAT family N-acetyltransferase n=1 Tax=Rhodovulum sp. YNF3179 TaxID=3425127 RepID=UPI003D3262E1